MAFAAMVIMGLTLGLLGGGGSILTVPILVYLFAINPIEATAYSLFVVGLSAGIGAISYYKKKLIAFKVGIIFAVPAFLGVFSARAWLVPALPEEILRLSNFVLTKEILVMLVFAVLMILASYSMIRGRKEEKEVKEKKIVLPLVALEGIVVGLLTGFVGAGGGFLIIPALVFFAGLPMKQAIGTSLMIISFKSLLGFSGDILAMPNIDWHFLFGISLLSIVGIMIGTYLVQFVPEKKLKKVFGFFVLIMGLAILSEQLFNR